MKTIANFKKSVTFSVVWETKKNYYVIEEKVLKNSRPELPKKFVNQKDVKVDLSIGHALVLFSFFFNNKQKKSSWSNEIRIAYIDRFWT